MNKENMRKETFKEFIKRVIKENNNESSFVIKCNSEEELIELISMNTKNKTSPWIGNFKNNDNVCFRINKESEILAWDIKKYYSQNGYTVYSFNNKKYVDNRNYDTDVLLSIKNSITIKNVIYQNPATIVFWSDGTKTVVKCNKETGDIYNPEFGLAMCIVKKLGGNNYEYYNIFKKWLPKK